jgi:hypothetical protein
MGIVAFGTGPLSGPKILKSSAERFQKNGGFTLAAAQLSAAVSQAGFVALTPVSLWATQRLHSGYASPYHLRTLRTPSEPWWSEQVQVTASREFVGIVAS